MTTMPGAGSPLGLTAPERGYVEVYAAALRSGASSAQAHQAAQSQTGLTQLRPEMATYAHWYVWAVNQQASPMSAHHVGGAAMAAALQGAPNEHIAAVAMGAAQQLRQAAPGASMPPPQYGNPGYPPPGHGGRRASWATGNSGALQSLGLSVFALVLAVLPLRYYYPIVLSGFALIRGFAALRTPRVEIAYAAIGLAALALFFAIIKATGSAY